MKISILPIVFISLIFCISCGKGKNDRILSKSESLLETEPDSALSVLSCILYPENLGEEAYNRYVLLKIQAEYKSHQDITSDSSILSVNKYYLKEKNDHLIALSSYYCGCYYNECEKKEDAMRFFLMANDYADKTNDSNLKGLIRNAIGVALLDQFATEEAMAYFRASAALYKAAGNLKNETISYLQIGNCFQYLEEPDSALWYYKDCLRRVDEQKSSKEQSAVRQSIGVLYAQGGEVEKAILYLKDALKYEAVLKDRFKIYNLLAKLYSQSHQTDSAHVYINYLLQGKEQVDDLYVRAGVYQVLSDVNEQNGDYLKALENHKAYSEDLLSILDENVDKKLLDIQKKYDYEKLRLRNMQLELKKVYYISFLTGGFLIILIIGYIFYRKYKRNKERLAEQEAKVSLLQNMAESFDDKEQTFRSYLLRHFEILKKLSNLEIYAKEGGNRKNEFWLKKINEILYGQDTLNWETLYNVMNELHQDFFTKLKASYPQLEEAEFRIICLTYAKFSSDEISIIMRLSINTIHAKRSAIRKKLGMEAFSNFGEFLDRELKK